LTFWHKKERVLRMIKEKWESRPIQTSENMHDRDYILDRLKKKGLRITNQRKLLIDILLKNECSCCKEIYYEAVKVILRSGLPLFTGWSRH